MTYPEVSVIAALISSGTSFCVSIGPADENELHALSLLYVENFFFCKKKKFERRIRNIINNDYAYTNIIKKLGRFAIDFNFH